MVRNEVTYTIWSDTMRLHVEQRSTLYRRRCLTVAGAERILRKEMPSRRISVERVESMHVE